jgi:hypothetical protein
MAAMLEILLAVQRVALLVDQTVVQLAETTVFRLVDQLAPQKAALLVFQ